MSARPSLGMLVAASPEAGGFSLVEAMVLAAIAEAREVGIFLMGDAVSMATDPRLRGWIDAGVDITVCAMEAERAGLDPAVIRSIGVRLGSQHDHARLLRDSQAFVSFT